MEPCDCLLVQPSSMDSHGQMLIRWYDSQLCSGSFLLVHTHPSPLTPTIPSLLLGPQCARASWALYTTEEESHPNPVQGSIPCLIHVGRSQLSSYDYSLVNCQWWPDIQLYGTDCLARKIMLTTSHTHDYSKAWCMWWRRDPARCEDLSRRSSPKLSLQFWGNLPAKRTGRGRLNGY